MPLDRKVREGERAASSQETGSVPTLRKNPSREGRGASGSMASWESAVLSISAGKDGFFLRSILPLVLACALATGACADAPDSEARVVADTTVLAVTDDAGAVIRLDADA